MSASPTAIGQSKPPKKSAVRKSTHKPGSIQTAIAVRRHAGKSKRQIAMELGIAQNTVTSIIELNNVDEQIAKARQGAIELYPKALTAIDRDLTLPGSGALGLRLLNDIGAIGEDAIESARRDTVRQRGAINVLVQAGATVQVGDTTTASTPVSKRNVPLSDATSICSEPSKDENNCTVPSNDTVTTRDGGQAGGGTHREAAESGPHG